MVLTFKKAVLSEGEEVVRVIRAAFTKPQKKDLAFEQQALLSKEPERPE